MSNGNDSDSEDEYTTNEAINYCPILSPNTPYPSLLEALEHDQKHDFDLIGFLPSPAQDDFFEQTIVIINQCRAYVQKNFNTTSDTSDSNHLKEAAKQLKEYLSSKIDEEEDNEEFFRPVLDDDALLMYIDDLEDIKEKSLENQKGTTSPSDNAAATKKKSEEGDDIEMYRLQIQTLKEQLKMASAHMATLVEEHDDKPSAKISNKVETKAPDNDSYYFTSYSHSSIHETMLKDKIRTEAYQNAILSNQHMFKDKVVMDIGCGTGILSLFAAKAGAKKVISIDASDMHEEAAKIVRLNGYEDVIHVIFGKVEDLIDANKLPLQKDEKVDVVISEWMGYALFYETMLPSVMVVRDELMNPTSGTMWPNRSTIYLEAATDPNITYWSDVYGFDMAVMKERVMNENRKEAVVEVVGANDIVTNRDEIVVHDLNKCRDEDLDFEVPFQLKTNGKGDGKKIDKLVVSFDIDFDVPGSKATSFSTGCQTPPTHWKQTSLWFNPNEGEIILDNDEVLKGKFQMGRNARNPRNMDFCVQWEIGRYEEEGANGSFQKRMQGFITTTLGTD